MPKVSIRTLDSVTHNDTTATTLINENFSALQSAIENTVSRDGTVPNFMDADLDLNSYRIINAGDPENDSDVITKGWFDQFVEDASTATADANAAAARAASFAQASQISSQNAVAASDAALADAGLAKDWATKMDGTVDGVDYSSKYYASQITSIATDISTVAGIASDVTTVADISSDVTDVADIKNDVTTVSGISSDVTAVKNNATDISAVAANETNISTVAGDSTSINAVAGDLTNIDAVAADLTNIDNASTYAAEAKQWAIGDPTEPVGNSAKYWADQAAQQVIPSQTGHSGEYLTTDGSDLSWNAVDALPDQTGQSGKYLTTDGTDASWANVDALPSQSGQSGKYLTTDGTDASWANVDALPSQTGQSGKYLTTDGSSASWATLSVNPDNKSINKNSSDQLQTIGVINQNDTTTALKVWSGDEADLPVTKDANTFYATEELGVSLLDTLYPVGSIYITTNAACPLSTLIAGSTWVLVGQDRVLQGAGTRGVVGTTLNESLPNITGRLGLEGSGDQQEVGGCVYIDNNDTNITMAHSVAVTGYVNRKIDASLSSSTYQDNAPVQPDAYLVNIFRRTN